MRIERGFPPVATAGVRPMEPRDVEAVAKMFLSVFRGGKRRACGDLVDYLSEFCFGSPVLNRDNGSIVYEASDGRVLAALIGVPMRFRVGGDSVAARLLCSFMADGQQGLRGAAALHKHLRTSHYDLLFSDTAVPRSARHWEALKGGVLPVESLEWRRVFRPSAHLLHRTRRRWCGTGGAVLRQVSRAPAALADGVFRRAAGPGRAGETLSLRAVDAAAFAEAAHSFLKRFEVHPDWQCAEFEWIATMAARNQSRGRLSFALAETAAGDIKAAYAYYAKPDGPACVLNLLCAPGDEVAAVEALLVRLDADGHTMAHGMAQQFLLAALQVQPHVAFRHRGYFLYASVDDGLRAAVEAGRFYAGGLASESWSRLVNDF